MTRSNSVRLETLAIALADLVARGYGDCPVFVETARDIGPLCALAFGRRGSAFYLCETMGKWTYDRTIIELAKTEKRITHE